MLALFNRTWHICAMQKGVFNKRPGPLIKVSSRKKKGEKSVFNNLQELKAERTGFRQTLGHENIYTCLAQMHIRSLTLQGKVNNLTFDQLNRRKLFDKALNEDSVCTSVLNVKELEMSLC